jgi:DNA invertase Pin-like site-specific DNA recombinase
MKSAIAYVRVSTEKQGYSGLGLDAQLVQITQFAADSGYEIVEPPVREIASATGAHSMRKRRKLGAAIILSRILSREKEWPIIVASLDRLSRNTAEVVGARGPT